MLSKREHQLAYTAIKTVWLRTRLSSEVLFRLANRAAANSNPNAYFSNICISAETQLRKKHNLKGRLPGHLFNWHSEKSRARAAFLNHRDPRQFESFWRWVVKTRKKLKHDDQIHAAWNRWLERLNNGEPEFPGLKEGIEQMRRTYARQMPIKTEHLPLQNGIANGNQQTTATNRRESAAAQNQRPSAKAPIYRKS